MFRAEFGVDPTNLTAKVLEDSLPSAENADCNAMRIHEFEVMTEVQYVKFTALSYHGTRGTGLHYLGVQ